MSGRYVAAWRVLAPELQALTLRRLRTAFSDARDQRYVAEGRGDAQMVAHMNERSQALATAIGVLAEVAQAAGGES